MHPFVNIELALHFSRNNIKNATIKNLDLSKFKKRHSV